MYETEIYVESISILVYVTNHVCILVYQDIYQKQKELMEHGEWSEYWR